MAENAIQNIKMPETHRRLLERCVPILRRELGDNLVELILFGSTVRGEAEWDSDVDIAAIVHDEVPRQERSRILGVIYDVELEERAILSVLYVDEEHFRRRAAWGFGIYSDIRREGIQV
jgi:predicted nucleotidyltransferase